MAAVPCVHTTLLTMADVYGVCVDGVCVDAAGHYELNLALPLHAAIATRLRDVSNDSPDGPTWMNLLYDCAT
jgi:hypothetical protein